jgi:hypothetical protein
VLVWLSLSGYSAIQSPIEILNFRKKRLGLSGALIILYCTGYCMIPIIYSHISVYYGMYFRLGAENNHQIIFGCADAADTSAHSRKFAV